jgi:hypothetical protein
MSAFFEGATVQDLIPGNPQDLFDLADQFRNLAGGLSNTTDELRAIEAGQWRGQASQNFQAVVGRQPSKYQNAGWSFQDASAAISSYAETLQSVQGTAASALTTWHDGQAQTSSWQNLAANGTQVPAQDPGLEQRQRANALLENARTTLDEASNQLAGALDQAAQSAPSRPSILHEILHVVEQFAEGVALGAWGIVTGLWDLAKLVYEDPKGFLIDAAMLTAFVLGGPIGWKLAQQISRIDPNGYKKSLLGQIDGAVRRNPLKFFENLGSNLIDLPEWEKDPARALGELVPTIVGVVLTNGIGAAAKGADASKIVIETSKVLDRTESARKAIGTAETGTGVVQAGTGTPGHTVDGAAAGTVTDILTTP